MSDWKNSRAEAEMRKAEAEMMKKFASEKSRLQPPIHVGDGLYFEDEGHRVAIAVNHHTNKVAYLDIADIETAINYLQKIQQKS